MRAISSFRRSIAAGFSLVELMVAMALGLLIVGVVIQLFAATRMTSMSTEALARVQENGRFALAILNEDIREAGVSGFCAGQVNVRRHLANCSGLENQIFNDRHAVFGYEFAGTGRFANYTIPTSLDPSSATAGQWTARLRDGTTVNLAGPLVNRVVPGSDVLVLRRPEVLPATTVATPPADVLQPIVLNQPHGLRTNEIVLITDCASSADLFQNTASPANSLSRGGASTCAAGLHPGNVGLGWSTIYRPGAQVFRVRTHAYFVGFNAARGEPGLYRADFSFNTNAPLIEEMVAGVENMQVLFGISNPGNATPPGDGQTVDWWVSAAEVSDWGLVIAVRLGLVVRSPENADGNSLARVLELGVPGEPTTITSPTDARLRQVFSTTLTLRNRQLVF